MPALRKSIYAPANQRITKAATLPAPIGGLNARDSLSLMEPTQAVELVNFFPQQHGLQVRRGWTRWLDQIPNEAQVETILKWNGQDGTEHMFAAAGGAFYDATVQGIAGTPVAIDFLNDRWQYVQMANIEGTFTVAVNGEDEPIYYDGTSWKQLALTISATNAPLYPNFDPRLLIGVTVQHRRLFFTEAGSTRAWYLPVDVVEGELTPYDLGENFPHGGYLQGCTYWSVEGGGGTGAATVSLNVFISSQGDVAVFSGYDIESPLGSADPNAPYTLGGIYKIGRTVGRRCFLKYGADVAILAENGVVLLSGLLAQSKLVAQLPITNLIQQQVEADITLLPDSFGWEMILVQRYNQLYLNVPSQPNETQFCQNTVTEAWCTFEGYNALCWALHYQEPYFGGPGYVGQAWYGALDDYNNPATPQTGISVQTRAIQAFNYLGSPGPDQKLITMIRPIFNSAGAPTIAAAICTDYNVVDDLELVPAFLQLVQAPEWDNAKWDDALWTDGVRSYKDWVGVAANPCFVAAPLIKTATVNDTLWVATDVAWQTGTGIL